MRIAVFGGTFDPIHVGHLAAAVSVHSALSLDRTLLVVARVPWQKVATRDVSPAEDRYAMVAAAVAELDVTGVEASRLELDRPGESYMADTLDALAAQEPGAALILVVGSDVAHELMTWVRWQDVRDMATLAVMRRGGAPDLPTLKGWRTVSVDIPALDVSSSDLRRRLAEGRPVEGLVPPAAVHLIRERGLYALAR